MKISSTYNLALRSLLANKSRSFLTMLGVVIGIAAVIVVYSAGEGIKGLILGQVESFGTDIIQSEPRVPSQKTGTAKDAQSGQLMAQGVQVTSLTISDMERIDRLPNVKRSYGAVTGQVQASYGSEISKSVIYAVSAQFINVGTFKVADGRFYTDDEDRGLAQVVVLGSKVKAKLFGESEAVGKMIRLKKSKYKVVGVMEERGSSGFVSFDDFVYVPVRTMQKKILGIDHLLSITTQLYDVSQAEATAESIRLTLREAHSITDPAKDDFRVATMAELMSTLGTITSAITLLLLAIVSISLVVGGVGITNVMYVVVTERTAEIGLRKAVGARLRDILQQFLIESVLVTAIGGMIGVVLGIVLSYGISLVANNLLGLGWEFILPLRSFVVAFIFSLVCGIGFGLYPALKASRLDPIAALRSE
jgi:putative ABC transport system permease protein